MSNHAAETGSAGAKSAVHHEDVGAAVYAVIPPRPVPLRKRIFWRLILTLLGRRQGRAWIAARYGITRGN
jgi:hypothetical protein